MGSRRLSEAADTPPIGLSMNRILVYTDHICSFFIYKKRFSYIYIYIYNAMSLSFLYLFLKCGLFLRYIDFWSVNSH